ncbi:MAG: TatD family hydrolase, partial [Gammaproteobacteria bacterium]|nr:TatD family hydrolase [Gammaproteobacteria bacterium]
FTGSTRELYDCLDLDLHIGVTGWICDERRGHDLREAVDDIPAGRLMIETDAPYLLPRDLTPAPKTRRNEPMHLPHILDTIARHNNRSVAELARETTNTARAFFGLAIPPETESQA